MKKINKLLPIGIIASAASIVVPVSVSCGSNTGSGQANLKDIYQNGFTRTTDVLSSSTKLMEKEATKYYLEAVKEHPEIVSDDLFEQFYIQTQLERRENNAARRGIIGSEANAVIKVSDVSANPDKGTISLKMSFDGVIPMYSGHNIQAQNAGSNLRVDVVGHYELTIKDFAIALLYNTEEKIRLGKTVYNVWNIYADYAPVTGGGGDHLPNAIGAPYHRGTKDLTKDQDWSVHLAYDLTYNWEDGGFDKETLNSKFNYQSAEGSLEWLSYYFNEEAEYYHALYLQKIMPIDYI